MNATENILRSAGFVASPNNIDKQNGREWYAGGPGIATASIGARIMVRVDGTIDLVCGYFEKAHTFCHFANTEQFFSWAKNYGTISESGQPAGVCNVWEWSQRTSACQAGAGLLAGRVVALGPARPK